ncbi:MAG: tol-pal system protein YbgF [Rhodobacteraceae bacterium]|nr:tol-pal system protein YbgF [Paracoccaceae bacterium]
MIRRAAFALLLCVATPVVAQQQETLADIKQELSVILVDLQRLKQELNTTGFTGGVEGGSVLDRVNAIEARVQALTSKAEELEFRIDRVVRDGTNRLGDLEFRLCELEEGCDIANLGETPLIGGVDAEPQAPISAAPDTSGLTVNENSDYQAAQSALDAEDFAQAVDLFGNFVTTYPGGPLTIDAQYYQGEAHEGLGEMRAAARAYLGAFSANPDGTRAPDALFKLGTSLQSLGQSAEACVTLGEVINRFPGGDAAARAVAAQGKFGC